jgi:predicted RNA-binding Zn ribbon-like protein
MANDPEAAKFKQIGGNPCLDFVNTVGGWSSNPKKKAARDWYDLLLRDKLGDYGDLVAWSRLVNLITEKEAKRLLQLAEAEPGAAAKVFQRALLLRETIYRLCRSVIQGWPPQAEDLENLNLELAIANRHEKLSHNRDGFGWQWNDREGALDLMLWQVAQAAAELLASDELSRLRQCIGHLCGWMFLDTSRNRSRQWCDMKDCGNLAKVRRFRERLQSK